MAVEEFQSPLVKSLTAELDDLADVRDALDRTLIDEPPAVARDGGIVRDGIDPELDDLRGISRSGKQRIAAMEDAERARTGISSLKIRYNRVFGYYIEVSKSNFAKVPADYIRKQNRYLFECIGDEFAIALQTLGDRLRQNVQQKRFRLLMCLFERGFSALGARQ